MEVLRAALSINIPGERQKRRENLVYHLKRKHPHKNVMQTIDKNKNTHKKNPPHTHKDSKPGDEWLNRSFGSVRRIIAFW